MTAIIDYGVGNLYSLKCSLEKIGEKSVVTADEDVLRRADRVILPGVGAFGDAADKLRKGKLGALTVELARSGKPLLGICLGMQLLFERSREYGEHEGLGLISGAIEPIADVIPAGYKIPHIGWNSLKIVKPHPLFRYIGDNDDVYFVHSYHATGCEADTIATTGYGAELTAAVARGNVAGFQFHPEKSGKTGLALLRAFCETEEGLC
ncbi:MAG: imidazole glycerol phosphate synthase subunit HisH [Clostridia bacterium]|nr:imidazole glycerol phosphate synthase subunit HisH [Clostridia bacterium]